LCLNPIFANHGKETEQKEDNSKNSQSSEKAFSLETRDFTRDFGGGFSWNRVLFETENCVLLRNVF